MEERARVLSSRLREAVEANRLVTAKQMLTLMKDLSVSIDLLKATSVGKQVNALRQKVPELKADCDVLLRQWRDMAKKERANPQKAKKPPSKIKTVSKTDTTREGEPWPLRTEWLPGTDISRLRSAKARGLPEKFISRKHGVPTLQTLCIRAVKPLAHAVVRLPFRLHDEHVSSVFSDVDCGRLLKLADKNPHLLDGLEPIFERGSRRKFSSAVAGKEASQTWREFYRSQSRMQSAMARMANAHLRKKKLANASIRKKMTTIQTLDIDAAPVKRARKKTNPLSKKAANTKLGAQLQQIVREQKTHRPVVNEERRRRALAAKSKAATQRAVASFAAQLERSVRKSVGGAK
ncbi:MAG: hypothetical protein MHM6MM_000652 [Cercozoa sp. M6MM]